MHQHKNENDRGLSADVADPAGAALDTGEQPSASRERDEPRQKIGERNGEEEKRGDAPDKTAEQPMCGLLDHLPVAVERMIGENRHRED